MIKTFGEAFILGTEIFGYIILFFISFCIGKHLYDNRVFKKKEMAAATKNNPVGGE